jgi:ketosteroid isomerase-like protein
VVCSGQGVREGEVATAHQEFQKSWSAFDVNKLQRLLSGDLVWIAFTGEVNNKVVMLKAFQERRMTHPQAEDNTRTRVFGDSAVVTMLMTNRDDRDPSLVRKMYMTEVWAKQGGAWRLVSFHSSLIPVSQR